MREFSDFGSMAAHLLATSALQAESLRPALEHGVALVVKQAKAEIGTYQGQIGSFNAWQELADATKADRVYQGFPENEPLLRTGQMQDSYKGEVQGFQAVAGSDDEVAVAQELGTETIPPRPVIGPAAMHSEKAIVRGVLEAYARAFIGSAIPPMLTHESGNEYEQAG